MKTKIFTFVLGAFFATVVLAQAPTTVIKKATVEPVIDGTIDAVWSETDSLTIDLIYKGETPTLGDVGTTWWKALWNDKGVYVLINVNDDVFAPAYGAATSYVYDHPEIYFDTNYLLEDGLGPQTNGSGNGNGHYQFAPHPVKDSINSGVASTTGANGSRFSYNVADPSYLVEYFIPFTKLIDGDGAMMDQTVPIGFDVTICDNDITAPNGKRHRAVWSNIGTINESWVTMDDCGTITLEGAETGIPVEKITVLGGTAITTDDGTLQMIAEVKPVDASNQNVNWVVEEVTGSATISSSGLLTAIVNGNVLVKAVATDGSFVEGKVIVTISGQKTEVFSDDVWNTFNQIENWDFTTDVSKWGGWVDGGVAGQVAPTTVDGVCVMVAGKATDGAAWHYQHNQLLECEPDVPYTFRFKSWSDVPASNVVDFESNSSITAANGGDQYSRYGTSPDANALNGTSEWNYKTSQVPKWYTFHVTFDKMIETTIQKVQWMISLTDATIYLDSIFLVKDDQLSSAHSLANITSKVQLYPNPVKTELTISKIAIANSKVSVYNALGQKLMEKTAKGTEAKFNVANLRKGMYFVRFSDGTSEKFTKQ